MSVVEAGRAARTAVGRRVWAETRPYRGRLVLLAGTVLLGAGLAVVPALLIRRLVDHGVLAGQRSIVIEVALVLAGIALLRNLIGLFGRWCSATIGEGLAADLRSRVFDHLLRAPYAFVGQTRTGALVSRLSTDVSGATALFTTSLTVVLSNLAALAFALAAMLLLEWRLTVAAVALLPFFLIPAKLAGRRLSVLTRDQAALNAELSTRQIERFGYAGALLGAGYGRPDADRRRLAAPAAQLRDLSIRVAVHGRFYAGALAPVAALAAALIYLVGGQLALGGSLTLGTLIALAALLTQVYPALSQLAGLPLILARSFTGFQRVFGLLDLPVEGEPGDGRAVPPGGSVALRAVSFGYPRPRATDDPDALVGSTAPGPLVLHDLNLEVETGRSLAVVGRSGSGKSTVAQLIARLYDPSSGVVAVNGVDVRELDLAGLRGAVGYLPQDAYLFHDTVRANLAFVAPTISEARLWEALAAVRLDEFVAELPDGLDTVVGDGGFRLSGGERQRLAAARLLLADPPIVILDEATAHLDPVTERTVQRALDGLRRGRTTIVIAHRPAGVVGADEIVVLDRGRIIERGRHSDLLSAGGAYATWFRSAHSMR